MKILKIIFFALNSPFALVFVRKSAQILIFYAYL